MLSQYSHTAWRLQDGDLPSPVFPITQTRDGYLWIGTQAGVLRFDGVRFIPLSQLAGRSLPNPFVSSLLGASDGSLWIGTPASVSRWDGTNLTDLAGREHGGFELREDRAGRVWFLQMAKDSHALCEASGSVAVCHGKEDGLDLSAMCCDRLTTDGQGTFWISTRTAVVRWQERLASETFPIEAKIKSGAPGEIVTAPAPDGALWVGIPEPGAGLSLQRLVAGKFQRDVSSHIDGSTLAAQAVLRDRNGVLWVGTIDKGIYRIQSGRVDHFDSHDGLSSDCIYSFFEDRAGNVWIATAKGIDRFRDFRVWTYSAHEGLSVDEVDSVLAARDGKIWVGTAGGLELIEQGQVQRQSLRSGKELPGSQVTSIIEDDTGLLWVGIDEGLWIFTAGKFTQVPGADGKALGWVIALTQDAQRDIWALVRTKPQKTVRIHDGKVVQEFVRNALPAARSLASDPQEGVWLGLVSGNLAHLRSAGSETLATHVDVQVRRLMFASNGMLLGASSKGLLMLKDGTVRLLTAKDGLPCDAVEGFVEDASQALWLVLTCSFAKIELAQLERAFSQSKSVVVVEVLDVFDGVHPRCSPFECAARAPNGSLWFANGVTLQTVDSHQAADRTEAPVYIEQLVADRKSHALAPNPMLPPLTRDVQIDYTAAELTVPQRVRFRYRLEGHDDDWVDAQARRQAFYTDLPPGDYAFRVAASRRGDAWSESPASVRFTVLPAFYQTGWFMLLVVAAAATLLWIVFGWRLGQAKMQMRALFEERHAERERIARELHDTFLQGVQGLMLRFQSAMERIPPSQPARALMEKALDHADEVIADGRDRVTQLRALQQQVGDLPSALQHIGEELAREGAVAFRLTVEGVRRALDPAANDEIQRIVQEALVNAFRHAQARQVDVGLVYTNRSLAISVVDDGRGFDVATMAKHGPAGHWGLKGMHERAANLRAQLVLSSRDGVGTAIELTVPAAIAFGQASGRWRRWLNLLRAKRGRQRYAARSAHDDLQGNDHVRR